MDPTVSHHYNNKNTCHVVSKARHPQSEWPTCRCPQKTLASAGGRAPSLWNLCRDGANRPCCRRRYRPTYLTSSRLCTSYTCNLSWRRCTTNVRRSIALVYDKNVTRNNSQVDWNNKRSYLKIGGNFLPVWPM